MAAADATVAIDQRAAQPTEDGAARRALLARAHAARAQRRAELLARAAMIRAPMLPRDAQLRAQSKAFVEAPTLQIIMPGSGFALPTASNRDQWARLGLAFVAPLLAQSDFDENGGPDEPALDDYDRLFDATSRALMEQVRPGLGIDAAARAELTSAVLADTAISELILRAEIDELPPEVRFGPMADLNARVYAEVFLTPATDLWLGMGALGAFDALPSQR